MNPGETQSLSMADGPALELAERVRLMSDGLINNSSVLVSGFIGIFLVPIMLLGLGADAYGLWVAAMAVTGIVGLLDFGLGWGVIREVAASRNGGTGAETARFVQTAGNAYLLIGIVGAVFIATLGLPLSGGLHLSAASRKLAPAVFALAGVSFFADRMLAFTIAVFRGLRRFDAGNLLWIAAAILRAAGIIVLIRAGKGLLPVTMWQAMATAAAALAGVVVIGRLNPQLRFRVGRFDWNLLRAHLPLGMASQLTDVANKIMWEMSPVIIGMVLGSGSIAVYYVAQKFPLAVALVIASASDALFPAISQHQRSKGIAHTREILEAGTRWLVVLALPLCLGLWTVAPKLLEAWIGNVRPGEVLVLRLVTAAVFVDAVAAASCQMLWGRGAMRTVLLIASGVAVASLGLTLALLPRIGIVGAAAGLFVPSSLGAVAFLRSASRTCGVRVRDLLHTAFDGLALPIALCLVFMVGVSSWCGPGWTGVIATALGGGFGYLIGFCFGGARQEEMMLARKVLETPRILARFAYRRLRTAVRKSS